LAHACVITDISTFGLTDFVSLENRDFDKVVKFGDALDHVVSSLENNYGKRKKHRG